MGPETPGAAMMQEIVAMERGSRCKRKEQVSSHKINPIVHGILQVSNDI